jgi:hypothetical protein
MLSDSHRQASLAHLNEIAPDTFDEGSFGPWSFTNLRREGAEWTLSFTNADGASRVGFTYEGDCVNASGAIVDEWFEKLNDAIFQWEADADE